MTDILDRVNDLAMAPLTNTPLTSTATTFEFNDQAGDISRFPDPGIIGYDAYVWLRAPDGTGFPHVVDADRAGVAERVRVTARDVGLKTLTVTRGASPIDLDVTGGEYWLVAGMTAKIVEDIDDRIFDFVGGDLVTTKKIDAPDAEFDSLDMVASAGVAPIRLFEDPVNGTSKINLEAPSSLAADFTMTLLSALPAGTEFLTITPAGVWGTSPATTAISLDDAYNVGSVITADAGPVEIEDAGGLQLTHTEPQILWETTGAGDFNWRTRADLNDTFLIERGDQDADVSDDTFEVLAAFDANTFRFGVSTDTPQDTIHAIERVVSTPARLRLQTFLGATDSGVIFNSGGTNFWEIGYDASETGFVVGRLSFSNPAIFVEDGTGHVAIGTNASPSGTLHVENTDASVNGLFVQSVSTIGGITCSQLADGFGLQIQRTVASTANLINFLDTLGTGDTVFIDTDAEATSLKIDSEAADSPLIDLLSLTSGNDRGDVSFGLRTVSITGLNSTESDVWYVTGSAFNRLFIAFDNDKVATVKSRLGPAFDDEVQSTISGGVLSGTTANNGHIEAISEIGISDSVDTLTVASARTGDLVMIRATSGHTITLNNNTGNLKLNGSNIVLDTIHDCAILCFDDSGSVWFEVTRTQSNPS